MEQTRDIIRLKRNADYGYTSIEADLTVLTFIDKEGFYVAYCPTLNLLDYGNSEEEAKANFAEMVSIYFETVREWGTLTKDLKRYGWDAKSKNQKKVTAPTLDDLKVSDPTYKSLIDSGTAYNISRTQPRIQQAIA